MTEQNLTALATRYIDLIEHARFFLFAESSALDAICKGYLALRAERDSLIQEVKAQMDGSAGTAVLQAVLDAFKGTLDPHTQIADHPNVKFAQMQHLKTFQAGWDAGFQEALTPDVFPQANRCVDAYQAYQASQTDLERR